MKITLPLTELSTFLKPACPDRPAPGAGIVFILICCLMLTTGLIQPALAADEVPAPGTNPAAQPPATDPLVVLVDGQPIKASELDAYAAATRLPREDALEDLIDLRLVRAAAAARKINAPAGQWSAEVRADTELALAKALGLVIPPVLVSLVVDHAWIRDAEDEKARAADRALLEQLRAKVEAGATIPEAYNQLNIDGARWHIGDHEDYPYDVIPAEAHDLPPGSLSPIIPGDGGLHLFKIYQRRQEIPIHGLLSGRLRQDTTIERPDTNE